LLFHNQIILVGLSNPVEILQILKPEIISTSSCLDLFVSKNIIRSCTSTWGILYPLRKEPTGNCARGYPYATVVRHLPNIRQEASLFLANTPSNLNIAESINGTAIFASINQRLSSIVILLF